LPSVCGFQVSRLMQTRSIFATGAAGWAVEPPRDDNGWLTISLTVIVCFVVGASIEMWFWDQGLLGRLVREDGVFENAEAIDYFAGSLLLLYVVLVQGLRNVWLLGLALLFFIVGGEEISWGQRIFAVSTPDALRAVNVQGETNLHNVEGINGSVRAIALMVLWGLFVAIPTAALFRRSDSIIRRLAVPVANWGSALAVVTGTAYMVLARTFRENVFQLDEVGELLVSIAALGLAVGTFTTVARAQTSADYG
jgi:hypothetical protein